MEIIRHGMALLAVILLASGCTLYDGAADRTALLLYPSAPGSAVAADPVRLERLRLGQSGWDRPVHAPAALRDLCPAAQASPGQRDRRVRVGRSAVVGAVAANVVLAIGTAALSEAITRTDEALARRSNAFTSITDVVLNLGHTDADGTGLCLLAYRTESAPPGAAPDDTRPVIWAAAFELRPTSTAPVGNAHPYVLIAGRALARATAAASSAPAEVTLRISAAVAVQGSDGAGNQVARTVATSEFVSPAIPIGPEASARMRPAEGPAFLIPEQTGFLTIAVTATEQGGGIARLTNMRDVIGRHREAFQKLLADIAADRLGLASLPGRGG